MNPFCCLVFQLETSKYAEKSRDLMIKLLDHSNLQFTDSEVNLFCFVILFGY